MNTDRPSNSSHSVRLEREAPHPICAQCGAVITGYVGSGICPACLLSMGSTPGAQTSSGDGPVTERWTTLFPELDFETCLSSDPDREVYLATHAEHGDLVRLSFVRGRQLRDTGGAQAWQRCAHALAQLNHPQLAKLLDYGEKGDSFFLLTRIPDGETLEEMLAGQDKGADRPHGACAGNPKLDGGERARRGCDAAGKSFPGHRFARRSSDLAAGDHARSGGQRARDWRRTVTMLRNTKFPASWTESR